MLIRLMLLVNFVFAQVIMNQSADASPSTLQTWVVDGVNREALVFAPSTRTPTQDQSLPLVFYFHGHGGNMRTAAKMIALQNEWPEAVVVYMQGLPTHGVLPDDTRSGWQWMPGQSSDRDIKFFDAVLATMQKTYRIDERRIFASGFSQGSYFMMLLWSKRGKLFASLAACAVSIVPGTRLSVPLPYLQIASESDFQIPIQNQREAITTVKKLNEASDIGQSCGVGCTHYPSPHGTPVRVHFHSGGHIVPTNAAALISTFFKQQYH